MAIDFPDTPTIGQNYTVSDRTWTWDGTIWKQSPAGAFTTLLTVNEILIVQDAANAVGLSCEDLIAEAGAWATS